MRTICVIVKFKVLNIFRKDRSDDVAPNLEDLFKKKMKEDNVGLWNKHISVQNAC